MLTTALSLEVFAKTDIGLVREQNEDYFLYDEQKGIFIVADGMGGHNAGEVASKLAVHTVFDLLQAADQLTADSVKKAIIEANAKIYKYGRSEKEFFGMGTTIVVLVIEKEKAFFAHVGDSRLYFCRDHNVQLLTSDHTLVNELFISASIKKNEETIPFKHILTKAVGTHHKVEPSMGSLFFKEKDCFLLCTDGLSNNVSSQQLEAILNKKIPVKDKGEILIDLAKNSGGGDNITLIIGSISAR